MSTPNPAQTPAKTARKKRVKKVTAERAAAELAYKNSAKGSQERTAARGALKVIRFREIVVPRVNRVLQQLARVEGMANRNAYTWNEEQAGKIVSALTKKVNAIVTKLSGSKTEKDSFAL